MNSIAWQTTVSMGILMAMGYLIRRKGWVDGHFTGQFSNMMYYTIIPCIILSSTINMEFSAQQLKNGAMMMGLSLVFILIMLIFGQGVYCLLGRGEEGRIMRFSMFYTNFTIMGLALAQLLYGDEGLFYFSMLLVPLRLYSYMTADWMLSGKRPGQDGKFRWQGLISPLLVYTLTGLLIYILQIPLPAVLSDTINTASKAMTPCGMILCGLLLAQTDIRAQLRSAHLYIFLFCKLILAPLLVLGVMLLMGVGGVPAQLCVLLASLPVAAALGAFAAKDHCAPESAAVYIAASTACSVVTIPLMVALAGMVC